MILEACTTVEMFTAAAEGKILAKMTPRKRAEISPYEYIVYLNNKDLHTKLNYVASPRQGITISIKNVVNVFSACDRIIQW